MIFSTTHQVSTGPRISQALSMLHKCQKLRGLQLCSQTEKIWTQCILVWNEFFIILCGALIIDEGNNLDYEGQLRRTMQKNICYAQRQPSFYLNVTLDSTNEPANRYS